MARAYRRTLTDGLMDLSAVVMGYERQLPEIREEIRRLTRIAQRQEQLLRANGRYAHAYADDETTAGTAASSGK